MKRDALKRINISILGIVFLLVAANSSCGIYEEINREVKSDAELEKNFRENRADFETLVRMAQEDSKVTRIAFDFTHVKGFGSSSHSGEIGFSSERWDEYKALFRKLGLDHGINREEDGTIRFFNSRPGIAVNGPGKDYLFTRRDLDY